MRSGLGFAEEISFREKVSFVSQNFVFLSPSTEYTFFLPQEGSFVVKKTFNFDTANLIIQQTSYNDWIIEENVGLG